MSKRLMPTYLVNFLKEIYDGTIPSNFGERMVSRQFISRVKELYETLGGDNPSDYSRRMVNEYLIKFFNEIEIVEYTDDDVKMTKTISSDLVYPACRIDAIGGMSYKSENLLIISDVAETTTNGITYKVENGVLSVSGTASADVNIGLTLGLDVLGTYFLKVFNWANGLGIDYWCLNNEYAYDFYTTSGGSITAIKTYSSANLLRSIRFKINNGTTISRTLQLKPMLVSGTTEPSKFKAYFAGIRDIKVTAVKTYNTDNELLDNYTVPSAITSLNGYGQGINENCYNNVDFASGKYIKKVGVVDLGTLDYILSANANTFYTNGLQYGDNSVKRVASNDDAGNLLCARFTTVPRNLITAPLSMSVNTNGSIHFHDDNYTTADAFKEAMDGVLLYYELATPVETTISENAPLLEVVEDGTIVFENEYNQDMPNEVTTWIKEN